MYIDTSKKIVVFDAGIPQLLENKVFDPALANSVSHTILPVCYLYQEALKWGIQFVTPDIFFTLPIKQAFVPLISNLTTPFTDQLISSGVTPTILACGESPFIATRFYVGLKRISAHFEHSFVFKGMQKRLSSKTVYHQMFFPSSFDVDLFAPAPFAEKKFVTMISGNKRIDNWKKNIILRLLYGFGVREIYNVRRSVVEYFSEKGFDLYGFGWEEEASSSIQKVYRGSVEDKQKTLAQYKFAFCFENSIFKGYITEKIFDAMFAGCVPIYYGAPDIFDYVPKDTFIDLRNFNNYGELHAFLIRMTEEDYSKYVERIKIFFQSEQYQLFSKEQYAQNIITILEEAFQKHA